MRAKSLSNPPVIMGLSKVKITILIIVVMVSIIGFIILNNKLALNRATNPEVPVHPVVLTKVNTTNISPNELLSNVMQIKQQSINKKASDMNKSIPPITVATQRSLINALKLQQLKAKLQISQQARYSKSLMYGAKELISPLENLKNQVKSTAKARPEINSDNTVNDVEHITPNQSPYTLKAGSIIAATMINGLNSDLAGEVVAYVRANIYDSMTRRYLLIPQGAKLIGVYDSHVIYGQKRLLVAWNRLIYPDGSSINLKAMPGTDIQGYSGFHDQVDNKYWQIFGASFIIGVITGGMQYAQNQNNASTPNTPATVQQSVSLGLAQQMGQTGLAITRKNLNLQPTIIIRPNYPFAILTTADLILKPWKVI